MSLLDLLPLQITPERFLRRVERRARRSGLTMAIDAGQFSAVVSGPDAQDTTLSMHNMYQEYLTAPRLRRSALIDRYLLFTQTRPTEFETWEAAKSSVLPRVRTRFYSQSIELRHRLGQLPFGHRPTEPFADHLGVELVLDTETTVESPSPELWDELGVELEEVKKTARDNLWQMSNEQWLQPVPSAPGLWQSPWQDTHDASRLVLHDLVWQLEVQGRHVAMVPNRDVLLVTGEDDEEGLAAMAALADEVMKQPRQLSGIPVVLDGQTWKTFRLPETHPAANAFHHLRVMSECMDYDEQKSLLDELFANEDPPRDLFVATCSAMEQISTGRERTYCIWARGLDAWLPRTDLVMLLPEAKPSGEPGLATVLHWDDVHRICGDLLKPEDVYPPRFSVDQFPDDQQLAELLQHEWKPDAGDAS